MSDESLEEDHGSLLPRWRKRSAPRAITGCMVEQILALNEACRVVRAGVFDVASRPGVTIDGSSLEASAYEATVLAQ